MFFEFALVKCDSIFIPDQYPRVYREKAEIAELTTSIQELGGVLSPIKIHRIADDSYLLIKGSRTLLAAIKAGLNEIPAIIFTGLSDKQIIEYTSVQHLSQIPLSTSDIAMYLGYLRDTLKLPHNKIAALIGWGDTESGRIRVGNYLRLLRFPEDVLSLFNTGGLTISHGVQLQRLLEDVISLEFAAQKTFHDGLSVIALSKLIDKLENTDGHQEMVVITKTKSNDILSQHEYLKSEIEYIVKKYACGVAIKSSPSGNITLKLTLQDDTSLTKIISSLAVE